MKAFENLDSGEELIVSMWNLEQCLVIGWKMWVYCPCEVSTIPWFV
jgi:hypothetical protein